LRQQINLVSQKHDHEQRPDWQIDYGELEPLIAEIDAILASKPLLAQDFPTRWLAIKLLENDREARRIIQHHLHEPGWEELLQTCLGKVENFRHPCEGRGLDERLENIVVPAQTGIQTEDYNPVSLDPCLRRGDGMRRNEEIIDSPRKIIAAKRNDYAEHIEQEVMYRFSRPRRRSDRADKILCHPIGGLFCVAAILFLTFSLAFNLADGWHWFPWMSKTGAFEWHTPLGAIRSIFFVWIPDSLSQVLPDGDLWSLLCDGIVKGVGSIIMFLPVIFFIFVLVAVLEQVGYMARVVVVLDRLMRLFGLHGHSIVPMLLAGGIVGGCAVPAVLAARAMREQRERLLTIMVLPLMNCGGKVPLYALLISAFFVAYQGLILAAIILISWSCALLAALLLGKWFVKGTPSPLLIELPTYQMPMVRDVLRTACLQCWEFLKRAGTIILLANVILWALMYYPKAPDKFRFNPSFAESIGSCLEPVSQYAGFDRYDNVALLGGLAAKEVVVSSMITMYELDERAADCVGAREPATVSPHVAERLGWTPLKAFAMLLFVMLYNPCMATCVVIWRETGHIKYLLMTILYTNALAFCAAMAVYQIGLCFG
jgi:ferrous iron transport protein B